MIFRETVWRDQRGGVRQVAVAVLADDWEPMWERFLPLGPFDEPTQAAAALLEDARSWYHLHGEQLGLWDALQAP